MIKEILGGLVSPITNMYNKRQDRKQAKEQALLKIQKANADASNELNVLDSEWEALSVEKQDSSLKDEYVTVIITLPIPLLFVASIYYAFTGDQRMLDGVNMAISSLAALGIDWNNLMYTVVLAAVGLKAWRGMH